MWRSWGRFLLEGLWSLRSTHAPYHKQRQPVLALERRVVRGLACGQETSGMREGTRAATECQAFRALPAAKDPCSDGDGWESCRSATTIVNSMQRFPQTHYDWCSART